MSNSIQRALEAPFPDEVIKTRLRNPDKPFHDKYNPWLTYAPPQVYRRRLHEVFKNGFKLEVTNVNASDKLSAVVAHAHFVGSEMCDEGYLVSYDVGLPVAEKVYLKDGQPDREPQDTMMKLCSAAVKAVSRELKIGLELYDKDKTEVAPAAGQGHSGEAAAYRPAQAPQPAGEEWDGCKPITFGKHKGVAYKDLPENYLTFLSEKKDQTTGQPRPDKDAILEVLRRSRKTPSAPAAPAPSTAVPAIFQEPAVEEDFLPW